MCILAATAFNIGNEVLVKGLLSFRVSTDEAVIAAVSASSLNRKTGGELQLLIICPDCPQQEHVRTRTARWFWD
jgi:hypothetical protein